MDVKSKVLALKYRPKVFSDLIGQQVASRTIYNSIKSKKYLVYVLKYRNRVGNPIGFDISIMKKFERIKGDVGAKFMVKRLKNRTNFINVNSSKVFKDFDLKKDFN